MPFPDDDFEDFLGDQQNCELCGRSVELCTCEECGMQSDGSCMLAGTEHCDWDCTHPSMTKEPML